MENFQTTSKEQCEVENAFSQNVRQCLVILVVHLSPSLSPQHTSLSASRSEKGTGWSSRSLGARCRNSIALCSDEQPHIGNYRLLKTIGKGNFAKVKLARHILTGKEVSLNDQKVEDNVPQKLFRSIKSCILGIMTLRDKGWWVKTDSWVNSAVWEPAQNSTQWLSLQMEF